MTWWQAALAYVIGPALVAAGTYAAARVASKGSEAAAGKAAEVEGESVQIEGYHKLVTDMRADLDRLREDHNALKADHEALKVDHDLLKHQAVRDQTKIRHLVNYIKTLRDHITRHGLGFPEAPAGLEIDGTLR